MSKEIKSNFGSQLINFNKQLKNKSKQIKKTINLAENFHEEWTITWFNKDMQIAAGLYNSFVPRIHKFEGTSEG
jgi:hypothetical protein